MRQSGDPCLTTAINKAVEQVELMKWSAGVYEVEYAALYIGWIQGVIYIGWIQGDIYIGWIQDVVINGHQGSTPR